MTCRAALAFIRRRGVVLVSAAGPVPKLVDFIAGEPVRGSWWGHPKGRLIFRVLGEATDSPDLLSCRLVGGKLTLVHSRLWPALIRAAGRFPKARLARVTEEHTVSGKHVTKLTPFPRWATAAVKAKAAKLSEAEALAQLAESGVSP